MSLHSSQKCLIKFNGPIGSRGSGVVTLLTAVVPVHHCFLNINRSLPAKKWTLIPNYFAFIATETQGHFLLVPAACCTIVKAVTNWRCGAIWEKGCLKLLFFYFNTFLIANKLVRVSEIISSEMACKLKVQWCGEAIEQNRVHVPRMNSVGILGTEEGITRDKIMQVTLDWRT